MYMSTISSNAALSYNVQYQQNSSQISNQYSQKRSHSPHKEKSVQYSRLGYLGSIILENARKISDFAHQTLFTNYKMVQDGLMQLRQIMKFSNLFDVAILPFVIVNIGNQAKNILLGNRNTKIDATIQLIADVGLLGRSLTIVAMGLVKIGGMSVKVLDWTSTLFFATSILSFAATASTYRTYVKMRSLELKFAQIGLLDKSCQETSLDTFHASLNYIKSKQLNDKDFIMNAFNCTPEKLNTRLLEIENEAAKKIASSNLEDQRAGKVLLNSTLNNLKGHIHHVGNKARNSVLISTIGLVAAVAFFATPPVAAFAYAVAGLGLAANIGILVHHKVVEYQYTKSLGLKKNAFEWVIC